MTSTIVPKTKSRKKKAALIVAVSLLVVLIVAVNLYRARADAGIPVQVTKVETRELGKNVFATGRVRVTQRQDFNAAVTARVAELTVKPGDTVKAGQVLGRLENEELLRRLNEAEAQLAQQRIESNKVLRPTADEIAVFETALKEAELRNEEAQENLKRVEFLYSQGAVAAAELEKARATAAEGEAAYAKALLDYRGAATPSMEQRSAAAAKLEQAEAAYRLAQKSFDESVFTAAMDGTVLTIAARQGDIVQEGDLIMTVGRLTGLEVRSEVSEADAGLLERGQDVEITTPSLPDKKFKGTISSVSPAATTRAGQQGDETTVEVVVDVPDAAGDLRPGYTADLNIITRAPRKALAVPYEAVIDKDDGKYVFVVENGKARLRRIQAGLSNELYFEITGGLAEGDEVVVSPPDTLKDGERVRPLPPAGGPGAKND